jgi:hypothetical protein
VADGQSRFLLEGSGRMRSPGDRPRIRMRNLESLRAILRDALPLEIKRLRKEENA